MRTKKKRILFSLAVIVDGQWVKYFVILWMVLSFGYDIRVTIYFSLFWEIVVKKPVLWVLIFNPWMNLLENLKKGSWMSDTSCSCVFHCYICQPCQLSISLGLLLWPADSPLTVPCCHSSASHWVSPSEARESQSCSRTPQSSLWPIVCDWTPACPSLAPPLPCFHFCCGLFCRRALTRSFF